MTTFHTSAAKIKYTLVKEFKALSEGWGRVCVRMLCTNNAWSMILYCEYTWEGPRVEVNVINLTHSVLKRYLYHNNELYKHSINCIHPIQCSAAGNKGFVLE